MRCEREKKERDENQEIYSWEEVKEAMELRVIKWHKLKELPEDRGRWRKIWKKLRLSSKHNNELEFHCCNINGVGATIT